MKKRKFLVLAMCIVMIFSTVTISNTTNVEAKATKKALKYLKGTWHTWDMPGYKVLFSTLNDAPSFRLNDAVFA